MKHGLIDGDLVLFRAAFAAGEWARSAARNTMELILSNTGIDSYDLFLTGKDNFRKDIYPAYKANRKSKVLPVEELKETKEYLIDNWGAEIVHGIEADDAMGLGSREDTLIITLDKDLDMIPGEHYNWIHDATYTVDEEQAFRNFCTQCIQGDRTDNIPGLYQVTGNKATKRVLGKLDSITDKHEMFDYVRDTYGKPHQPTLHMIASLLWIQRGDARTYDQYLHSGRSDTLVGQTTEVGEATEESCGECLPSTDRRDQDGAKDQ